MRKAINILTLINFIPYISILVALLSELTNISFVRTIFTEVTIFFISCGLNIIIAIAIISLAIIFIVKKIKQKNLKIKSILFIIGILIINILIPVSLYLLLIDLSRLM